MDPVVSGQSHPHVGTPRFDASRLQRFVSEVLEQAGLTPASAAISAEVLIAADLYGIDSHGVARLPWYLEMIRAGAIDPRGIQVVVQETATTAMIDARNGFGPPSAVWAMERCLEKALETGVAMVAIRNSNHFGIAGYYAMMAVSRGLCGVAMTDASPQVVPLFGCVPRFGTNPLAVAIPAGEEWPFLLDMSTSTVSWGKIEIARRKGSTIPLGWALDDAGQPSTDPERAVHLLPLGGNHAGAGYKGYGLGTLVEILCGPLAGAAISVDIPRPLLERIRRDGIGHFFAAWQPDAFRPLTEFRAEMDRLIRTLRSTPPAMDYDRVYVAGELEFMAAEERRRTGVPIHPAVVTKLEEVAARADLRLGAGIPGGV